MTTFLLVRHGLTDAVDHVLTGTQSGVHLNAAGREQVARLAERLRYVSLVAVASSPLERALETATPIAANHQIDVQTIASLTEFEVGQWAGRTFASLDGTVAWQRFNAERSLTRAPGGELMLDVQRRGISALLELQARHPSGSVAVVSHGDVIRAMLLYALGMPIDFFHRLDVAPASISVLELGDGPPRVRLINGGNIPGEP
ncbi:MAG TPA: histidine phosphatase family protein [Vicinamibacterales bacterium]